MTLSVSKISILETIEIKGSELGTDRYLKYAYLPKNDMHGQKLKFVSIGVVKIGNVTLTTKDADHNSTLSGFLSEVHEDMVVHLQKHVTERISANKSDVTLDVEYTPLQMLSFDMSSDTAVIEKITVGIYSHPDKNHYAVKQHVDAEEANVPDCLEENSYFDTSRDREKCVDILLKDKDVNYTFDTMLRF